MRCAPRQVNAPVRLRRIPWILRPHIPLLRNPGGWGLLPLAVSSPNKPALTPAPQPPAVPAPKKTLSLSDTDFLVEPAVTPPEAGTEVLPKKPKTVTSPTRRKDIP
jgi:hypothetical protein